jgi:opacity protein-like surface antigen
LSGQEKQMTTNQKIINKKTKTTVMKKLFFATLITVAAATSAFAKDVNKVNYRAQQNFKLDFKGAEKISWTVKANFAKADFTYQGEKMEVFYNTNGEMIGTSKNITLDQLPTYAKRMLAKKYNGFTITEAIRFEGNDESAYYVSAENNTEKVILKVSDDSQMSLFERNKK